MKVSTRAVLKTAVGAWLASWLFLMTGCATVATPMFQQLEAEKTTQITLVVERAPFEYTAPVTPDLPFVGGGVAGALFGPALVQFKIDQIQAALNERARARGIANDHGQVLIAALVQQLAGLGLTATVVPLPYERRFVNGDRLYFRPLPDEVAKLPKEPPAFYLNVDMGSCTVDKVTPCIRYILNPASAVVSQGPNQRYGAMWVFEPNLWTETAAKSALRFESLEDATNRIEVFDAEIARLVPLAAARLAVEGRRRVPPK